MKVSLNWIKFINEKYGCAGNPAPAGVDKLVEKIGAQLGAVDNVTYLGERYKGAVVAKVVDCQKHPNADKLSICLIDDGKKIEDVNRDKEGFIQLVCGAPNVAKDQLVVWLPPGATVPNTYDKHPFILEAREIRGVVSNGMLASAKELAIGDDHSGILVVEDKVKPGTPFVEAYDLDDYIIDIENKMFTHRPDCFGMLGVAREIAGIQQKPFKSPAWYIEDADLNNDGRKNVLKLSVKNELPKLVPRFTAIAIKDVKVAQSPTWLKVRLASVGVRPINNVVDLTNFFMLETGQPLHAYDYDRVKSGILGVRESREGESVTVIGGKTIKLKKGVIVITNGSRAIGLGGVMGGADTEVDEATKNIILEVANFDMSVTRRTAMEYGLFTDAATRFTKNQSSRQQKAVLCKAVEDIKRIAGGRVASPIIDQSLAMGRKPSIQVSREFINSRLGSKLTTVEMKKLLENVEFEVEVKADELGVLAPFWRTDVEIPEDVVEEVGRLHGYEHLPLVLPKRNIKATTNDRLVAFKENVRQKLAAAGANELLTYSFVHESLLEKVGQSPNKAYHIKNALSPNLQYYRLSLVPSLLEKVHPNIKQGFDEFAIYEINKSHSRIHMDPIEPDLPRENQTLALVTAGRDKTHQGKGAAFYQARAYLDYLAKELSIRLVYLTIEKESDYAGVKPFDHQRSALVSDVETGEILGIIGEFKSEVIKNLKLPRYSAGFEIGVVELLKASKPRGKYQPLNRFPSLEQDLCLRVAVAKTYGELTYFLETQLAQAARQEGYIYNLEPLDIFVREDDKKHKQITWHIELEHPERTLTSAEANNLFDKISREAKTRLNAERI